MCYGGRVGDEETGWLAGWMQIKIKEPPFRAGHERAKARPGRSN
jgi:hypothetical protein